MNPALCTDTKVMVTTLCKVGLILILWYMLCLPTAIKSHEAKKKKAVLPSATDLSQEIFKKE